MFRAATLIGERWRELGSAFVSQVRSSATHRAILEQYQGLSLDTRRHLMNLVRFPKSHVLLFCRLLTHLLEANFSGGLPKSQDVVTKVEPLFSAALGGGPNYPVVNLLNGPLISLFEGGSREARTVTAYLKETEITVKDPVIGSSGGPYLAG